MSWSETILNIWMHFNEHRKTIRKCNQPYLMTWPWDFDNKGSNHFCLKCQQGLLLKSIDHCLLTEITFWQRSINYKNPPSYVSKFRILSPTDSWNMRCGRKVIKGWYSSKKSGDKRCLVIPAKFWSIYTLLHRTLCCKPLCSSKGVYVPLLPQKSVWGW